MYACTAWIKSAVCKLRTYPLGFGLQYLSCFSSLKTEGNKLRKQYKAGYNMCIHPLKSPTSSQPFSVLGSIRRRITCVRLRCRKLTSTSRLMPIFLDPWIGLTFGGMPVWRK